jgi:hypothetical protein
MALKAVCLCVLQGCDFWGASLEQLELHDWWPLAHGPEATCIPLAGVTKAVGSSMGMVGHPMPKLDGIHRLASAMVKADHATRHVIEAWQALQLPRTGTACVHGRVHVFPKGVPLLVDGVVLVNFPALECCTSCGYSTASYPGVPHSMRHVGYGKLKSKN